MMFKIVIHVYILQHILTYVESETELDYEETGGAFVFRSYNEELCEEDTQSGKASKSSKPACKEENLQSYLASLQVINPESVIALATKNKLDKSCKNVSKTISQTEKYMKSCTVQPAQEVYKQLLRGVSTLHKKLCTGDPYHKQFMEYNKCYGQLQSEFDSCHGPADWSDNSDGEVVCKAYREIADCYYIKTSVLCGNKAADVFKQLVLAVVDSVLTVDCSGKEAVQKHFGDLGQNMSDAQPLTAGSESQVVPGATLVATLLSMAIISQSLVISVPR